MIRIKSKLTGKPIDVKWKFWIDSPEFKDTRNDWEIVEYIEPPVQLYKRANIHSEFEEAGIHDKSVGVSMHNQKPQLYRFDELDPKTLKTKRATPLPSIKPLNINLSWYKKLSHDSKVMFNVAIITLTAMIIIGIATLALM